MNITQLTSESKQKSLAAVARDLDLHPRFAAPDHHSATIALMAKHIDQLRLEIELLRVEVRRRWWHRFWRSRR